MTIDRNNYEEYFILYMDNELNAAERRMVESFVQLHPDLKDELDLLLQFKLEPDSSIVFERKEELLVSVAGKNGSEITKSNSTEWLLSYIDNELTPEQKRTVDTYIQANPSAKAELEVLTRAKLEPETIIFPNKQGLYRTKGKVRVIPARWWRVAAAAVLLIGLGLTTLVLVNRKQSEPEIVNKPGEIKNETPLVNNKETQPVVPENNIIKEENAPVVVERPSIAKQETKKPAIKVVENKTLPVFENKKNEEVIVANTGNDKPSNNLPEPVRPIENRFSDQKQKDAFAINDPSTKPLVTSEPHDPLYKHAAVVETEPLEQPEKKNKLRGIFRKVARTLEKRTNIDATDNENRLLVAGLSIKLK